MDLVKPGTRISLNLPKRLFYFQGKDGINLSEGGQRTQLIPDDISDKFLDMINHAVRTGSLVIGWPPDQIIEVPEDRHIGDILKNGRNKIFRYIEAIRDDKNIKDQERIVKLETLLAMEKMGKNIQGKERVSVTGKIEKILSTIPGISSVIDVGDGEEIKINITN